MYVEQFFLMVVSEIENQLQSIVCSSPNVRNRTGGVVEVDVPYEPLCSGRKVISAERDRFNTVRSREVCLRIR